MGRKGGGTDDVCQLQPRRLLSAFSPRTLRSPRRGVAEWFVCEGMSLHEQVFLGCGLTFQENAVTFCRP